MGSEFDYTQEERQRDVTAEHYQKFYIRTPVEDVEFTIGEEDTNEVDLSLQVVDPAGDAMEAPYNLEVILCSDAAGNIPIDTAGGTVLAVEDGADFGNQPNNDGVEIVSAEAGDTTQTCTVYGTEDGDATLEIFSETVTLTGDTPVATDKTDWSVILGIELSAVTAGNITVREASADAAIVAITAGETAAGVSAVSPTAAYDVPPVAVADGSETDPIGIIGTDIAGDPQTAAIAMTGATAVAFSSSFGTVTKLLHGAPSAEITLSVGSTAPTSIAIASGGEGALLSTTTAGVHALFVTNSEGLLELTITESAESTLYAGVRLPHGEYVVSSAITFTE